MNYKFAYWCQFYLFWAVVIFVVVAGRPMETTIANIKSWLIFFGLY